MIWWGVRVSFNFSCLPVTPIDIGIIFCVIFRRSPRCDVACWSSRPADQPVLEISPGLSSLVTECKCGPASSDLRAAEPPTNYPAKPEVILLLSAPCRLGGICTCLTGSSEAVSSLLVSRSALWKLARSVLFGRLSTSLTIVCLFWHILGLTLVGLGRFSICFTLG